MELVMKYAMFAALSMFSLFASAAEINLPAETAAASQSVPAVQYDYSQKLDIAHVINISTASSVECEPVKSNMIYVDSHGVRHNLEYMRLSDSCADS
jgi:hypothetical protein